MKKQILLGACLYDIGVGDKMVFFVEVIPVWGHTTSFHFLRKPILSDGNPAPGIWYFNSEYQHVPLSHIKEASQYCEENFGKNFEPYPEGF